MRFVLTEVQHAEDASTNGVCHGSVSLRFHGTTEEALSLRKDVESGALFDTDGVVLKKNGETIGVMTNGEHAEYRGPVPSAPETLMILGKEAARCHAVNHPEKVLYSVRRGGFVAAVMFDGTRIMVSLGMFGSVNDRARNPDTCKPFMSFQEAADFVSEWARRIAREIVSLAAPLVAVSPELLEPAEVRFG